MSKDRITRGTGSNGNQRMSNHLGSLDERHKLRIRDENKPDQIPRGREVLEGEGHDADYPVLHPVESGLLEKDPSNFESVAAVQEWHTKLKQRRKIIEKWWKDIGTFLQYNKPSQKKLEVINKMKADAISEGETLSQLFMDVVDVMMWIQTRQKS